MTPAHQRAESLGAYPHGFFGRAGGVSHAPFDTLNTGLGSGDDMQAVAENRRRLRRHPRHRDGRHGLSNPLGACRLRHRPPGLDGAD